MDPVGPMKMEVEQFQMNGLGLTKQTSFGYNLQVKYYRYILNQNALKVDQPAGAGFSSGIWDYGENGVAEDFYDFLQEFYKQLPQYKDHDLYITGKPRINLLNNKFNVGESYAGHYIPAISNHIWEKNQEGNGDFEIPLKGLAIGNGLTNTEMQYTAYPDMALDGGLFFIFLNDIT